MAKLFLLPSPTKVGMKYRESINPPLGQARKNIRLATPTIEPRAARLLGSLELGMASH